MERICQNIKHRNSIVQCKQNSRLKDSDKYFLKRAYPHTLSESTMARNAVGKEKTASS